MFIKGIQSETFVLNGVEPSKMSVDGLKMIISQELEMIPVSEQRLLFAGRHLEDGMLLSEYGIEQDSTVHLSLSLLGGGKKRKKKQYTGPKKQKHIRKKVKLGVLKLYKIDDNDKIHRQRIECTSATCGAGIFMAKHKDRHYCGKCHSTMTEKN